MRLSLFVPYLWYLIVQEIGVEILYTLKIIKTTGVYYNIYRPLAVTFFFFTFYRMEINSDVVKKFMRWMYIGYLAFVLLIFILTTALNSFSPYIALSSGFVICCFALSFLINYFNLDDPDQEKHWYPVVLITVGILAFYPVINIAFAFYKHLLAAKTLVFGTKLYQSIPEIMSIFMYSCFTYAFYLCRKKP
ncbi:MAG: hypothetical protein ABW007_10210 [Chitinophagaceae bacterium]